MARKRKARRPARSKFEQSLMDRLDREGVPFEYEAFPFAITVPVRGPRCTKCGSKDIVRDTRYTPDFFFPRWIVEAKGKFTANDRKRVLAFVALPRHKGKDQFAMLFMRDNKLSKASNTRYSDWCRAQGIPYAVGWFDKEWLR